MENEKLFEKYLHANIPLTKAMGIQAVLVSAQEVILEAPFPPNINHKKTVFGASLNAIATLACWGLLHTNLNGEDNLYEIVITRSEADYNIPVVSAFKAQCSRPDDAQWQHFLKTLHLKGKSRVGLTSKIYHEGKLAVEFHGTFAAFKRK